MMLEKRRESSKFNQKEVTFKCLRLASSPKIQELKSAEERGSTPGSSSCWVVNHSKVRAVTTRRHTKLQSSKVSFNVLIKKLIYRQHYEGNSRGFA